MGALAPGIKLVTVPVLTGESESVRAILAPPNIAPLSLPPDIAEELRRRMVLFYVGKRRVAYNMLREIVLRYLSDSPDVTHALDAIHSVAFEMRDALLAGDFDRFGSLMTRTRMLCRLLYPGTTSETIENIFAAAAPYSSGGKCMGAGGGGFMMIIAKSPQDTVRIRERLKLFSYRGLGEFYDFEVDEKGLHEKMV